MRYSLGVGRKERPLFTEAVPISARLVVEVWQYTVLLETSFESCRRFIFIYSLLSVSSGHRGGKVTGFKVSFSVQAAAML